MNKLNVAEMQKAYDGDAYPKLLAMRVTILLIGLSLLPSLGAAQETPQLTSSSRLRVTTATRTIGTYQALTDSTLVLQVGPAPYAIPLSSIGRLELSQGRKLSVAGGVTGFILGGAAGAALGCAANRDSYGVFCGGQNDTKVVLSAAAGGAAGAFLGAMLFRRERWLPLDIARLR